jgi:2,4-dienoyl-CoA reductase (NADPH2)
MLNYEPVVVVKRIAVVGAGPAGLAYATVAAERGHSVTLFDAASEIGGQFNLAKRIPGKEEFTETLRYYGRMLEVHKVNVRLNTKAAAHDLADEGFDEIVIATGISPRKPNIEGIDHPMVANYIDVIMGRREVGRSVAIIGAGGIGFDVAELISHSGPSGALNVDVFAKEWGIDFENHPRGGVTGVEPVVAAADREIFLLQRKTTALGRSLGRTTGWTHRITLNRRGVKMVAGVEYQKIDDDGLHIAVDGDAQVLPVDTVIICAGQTSLQTLHDELAAQGVNSTLVGGAYEAVELDAKGAIKQACELAAEV